MTVDIDQDAIIAAADLAGRSGARNFEIGYLHDDVPASEAAWYAHCQLRGARITVEDLPGPVEAADALSRRLLAGAKCAHCKQPVRTLDEAGCRWTRMGPRWARGCEA